MNSLIPISGLQAATARLTNSAHNVANSSSLSSVKGEAELKPFQPSDIVQSSLEPRGGVNTGRRVRHPVAELLSPQQDNENNTLYTANDTILHAAFNATPEREIAEQILSSQSFLSNLQSLQANLNVQDSLLDIAA